MESGREKRQSKDTRDGFGRIVPRNLNAVIGASVTVTASFEQTAQSARIARQRPVGMAGDPPFHHAERAIEPDGDAVVRDQLEIFFDEERATAERDHLRTPGLHIAHTIMDRSRFHAPEFQLAVGVEKIGDCFAFAMLDFLVQIDKMPAELVSQGAAYRCFAASHEPDQIDRGGSLEFQNHFRKGQRESDNGSMQDRLLPLFPLQVVLLPGGDLPLHIFEDRYKEMIGEVIRDRREFGVVLAGEKGIVDTGCTAMVDKVLRQYPDGRMDILTRGRRRFEIVTLNDERVFLRGEVEFFDDEDLDAASPEIQKRAIEGFNELQALTSDAPIEPDALTSQLSFRMAQAVTDVTFRQSILTTRSEADRLRQIADFLPEYLTRQRRIQHVKDVAPRNGHGRSLHDPE